MMNKTVLLTGASLAIIAAVPAFAQTDAKTEMNVGAGVTTQTATTTTTTSTTTSTENIYNDPYATDYPVTFYYYDEQAGLLHAAREINKNIFDIWDTDHNGLIDPQEYYSNEMVVYEPVQYSSRTFTDIDADGQLELTRADYNVRLNKVSAYSKANTDDEAGLTVEEFLDAGMQLTDDNDDNQISYDEMVEQFYNQPRLASEQERYNQ